MKDKGLVAGIVLFLIGGAILAFGGGGSTATGIGTTVGLAGVVLAGWAWFAGRGSGD